MCVCVCVCALALVPIYSFYWQSEDIVVKGRHFGWSSQLQRLDEGLGLGVTGAVWIGFSLGLGQRVSWHDQTLGPMKSSQRYFYLLRVCMCFTVLIKRSSSPLNGFCRLISSRALLPSPILICIWLQLLGGLLLVWFLVFFWLYCSLNQLSLSTYGFPNPLVPSPFLPLARPTSVLSLWHLGPRCCYTADDSLKPLGPPASVCASRTHLILSNQEHLALLLIWVLQACTNLIKLE